MVVLRYRTSVAMLRSLAFALLVTVGYGALASDTFRISRRNGIPRYSYDADTTKYCWWWLDNDGSWTCQRVETELELPLIDFHQWACRGTCYCLGGRNGG